MSDRVRERAEPGTRAQPAASGRVEGIFIAEDAAGPMTGLARVHAVPGVGFEGDRYAAGAGTWSKGKDPTGRQVTLVQAEALEALRERGMDVELDASRRNVVTRGVLLNDLVGVRFRVGPVELVGVRRCDPCMHMERLSGVPGIMDGLEGRGGLRADILTEGDITVGDPIEVPEA